MTGSDPAHSAEKVRETGAMSATPREHLGWLMWCYQEGYIKAEDRAGMDNWLLQDPKTLHPDDAALRPHLLAMADEVLAHIGGDGG